MRSLALNFLVAAVLFGAVFWYYFSKEQADIASLGERYGVTEAPAAASAPAPDGAGPAISTTPASQPGS